MFSLIIKRPTNIIYCSSVMILFWTCVLSAQSWQSSKVQMDESGNLTYAVDDEGNLIPDFSYAGYRNSEVDLPVVETVLTISPVTGDNTSNIQSAIDAVGSRNPDVYGFRGAVYLEAGEYEISGTLYLNQSGVVLRGAGDGVDALSNTIIKPVWTTLHTAIIAGGGYKASHDSLAWYDAVPNTTRNIITDFVQIGSRSFEVEDASPFQIGDNIIIYHPCTSDWLQAVDYGGTAEDPGWTVGSQPLVFNRNIKSIQDNWITIGAPVFNHLDGSLAQSYIYKYGRSGLLTNIGIEDLRIDIQTTGSTDENHAWTAIDLAQIEDAWVRNCTMLHFGLSGIRTFSANRVTIENCQALDPHSINTTSRRYNFHLVTGSQQILFKDCHATNGRHHYVSNGASSTSGCVFYSCTSSGAYDSSEGHRRWSMGLLYDNHRELTGSRDLWNYPRMLGLFNRGDWGTGHGWSAAHSVCWNCDVNNGDIAIQKPPTAQNYAIGCSARLVTGLWPRTCPFLHTEGYEGYIEGTDTPDLEPESLFLAQLYDRLNNTSGQTGPIIDSFIDGSFSADPVWAGDMNDWQVVTDSDVSTGASYSYTLRLNVSDVESGTKYLSTQRTASWGTQQTWGVWIGRRQTAASTYNQSIIWLWASEPNLTSPTVDGYRIRFGENVAGDEIILQRVDNRYSGPILWSSGAVPNNLTDIGFLVRVTRTESSEWTIYTSVLPTQNGQGAVATDIPSADNTPVYQGSYTDNTYTNFDNGYFGFMAVHTSDINSRTAAEFDQLYFDTRSDASLPVELISFTAIAGDGKVELDWSTASEIQNIGFIILRGTEKGGDYAEIDSYKNNPRLRGAGSSSDKHFYHYVDYDTSNKVTYWYKLVDVDFYGVHSEYGPISTTLSDNTIEPKTFYLEQNHPNPFNPKTMINYQLPINTDVELSIYNLLGQKMVTIINSRQQVGYHQVEWDANQFSSGVYYYRIEAGDFQDVKKMILLR